MYIGSCCFHRREAFSGEKYQKECHINWEKVNEIRKQESSENELEETAKLANCSYEENTSWGNEVLSLITL